MYVLLCALASLLPLYVIKLGPYHFNPDWHNHIWAIGNIGEVFKATGHIPYSTSTFENIGYPLHVFYANLFYVVTGIISSFTGPHIALRVILLIVTVGQFFVVERLFFTLTSQRWWAFTVALLVQCAIYPLTNLYNRAAIPEYVANCCLIISVASLFRIQTAKTKSELLRHVSIVTLALTFLLGTHPITSVYTVVTLIIFSPWFLLGPAEWRGKVSGSWFVSILILALLVVGVVTLPWAYIVALYTHKLAIVGSGPPLVLPRTDDFWVRFSIFPMDPKSLLLGYETDTPYLDTQVNMPLFFFVLGLAAVAWSGRTLKKASRDRLLLLAALGFFLLSSWMSLSITPYQYLPNAFSMVQMVYRLISFQNLGILMALVALIKIARDEFQRSKNTSLVLVIMSVSLALSFGTYLVKYPRTKAARGQAWKLTPVSPFLHLPEGYPTWAYITKYAEAERPMDKVDSLNLPVSPSGPLSLELSVPDSKSHSQRYLSNIAAFDWNHIFIDEVEVQHNELTADHGRLVVNVPTGRHIIKVNIQPERSWIRLRQLSYSVLVACILATFSTLMWPLLRRIRI